MLSHCVAYEGQGASISQHVEPHSDLFSPIIHVQAKEQVEYSVLSVNNIQLLSMDILTLTLWRNRLRSPGMYCALTYLGTDVTCSHV